MAKPLCIYHGNCADGFTAAWAVWKRFGDTFDYHPGVYQDAPPDVAGRDVVIVDFSYKRAVLLEMANSARSVFVLDHHKTAAEDLAGFLGPVGYNPDALAQQFDEQRMPPISVLFDMNRSGAGIAWDFFHPGKPRPRLIDYVEDRDLWRFNLPGSRAFSANLFSLAYDFHIWDRVARASDDDRKLQAFIDEGEAIERKHHKDVAELVKALKRDMTIGGYRVPVANLPYTLTSDAGHLMCEEWNGDWHDDGVSAAMPPFAACYWDTPKGRVYSLRSVGNFDVAAIAAKYGGGGHKNASGFTLPHGVEP